MSLYRFDLELEANLGFQPGALHRTYTGGSGFGFDSWELLTMRFNHFAEEHPRLMRCWAYAGRVRQRRCGDGAVCLDIKGISRLLHFAPSMHAITAVFDATAAVQADSVDAACIKVLALSSERNLTFGPVSDRADLWIRDVSPRAKS